MTQGEFLYNKFDYEDLDGKHQKYYNDNGKNFPDPQKQWFFVPYDQWFLNKDEREPLQGNWSWFDSVVRVVSKATKVIRRKRIRFKDVKIVVAKDHELLQQYYDLREKSYRKKLGFPNYDGQENDYDRVGDIILGTYEGKVVAGARVDFSNRNKIMYNENAEDGFIYRDLIKRFDPDFKEGDIYSEICSLAINERVAPDFFEKFFRILIEHSINMDARYTLGVAYPMLNDIYNRILSDLNRNFKIFDDIIIKPKHGGGVNKLNLPFSPIIMKNY